MNLQIYPFAPWPGHHHSRASCFHHTVGHTTKVSELLLLLLLLGATNGKVRRDALH
jgi:hypothetical protein